MDERPVQPVKEVKPPIAATKAHPKRVDYEYERAGVANVFMFAEPLAGQREVEIRETKTKMDGSSRILVGGDVWFQAEFAAEEEDSCAVVFEVSNASGVAFEVLNATVEAFGRRGGDAVIEPRQNVLHSTLQHPCHLLNCGYWQSDWCLRSLGFLL